MDTSQTWGLTSDNLKTLKICRSAYSKNFQGSFYHDWYFDSFHSTQKTELNDEGPSMRDIGVSKSNIKIGLPFPLSSPTVTRETEKDNCLHLVEKKDDYLNALAKCRRKFKADKKRLTTRNLKQGTTIFLPQYFVDLTTGKIKDVDPYFNDYYDYYYAGGNLGHVAISDNTYLVHPTTVGKVCFTATELFPRKNVLMNFNDGAIYNIRSSRNRSKQCLSIRQKYDLFLYKINVKQEATKVKKSLLWHIKSEELPFIDCKHSDGEMAYVDVAYNFGISDLEINRLICSHQFPMRNETTKGDLAQFEYLNKNTVFFMGRTQAHLLDKRNLDLKTFNYKVDHFNCDNLCAFCVSSIDNNYAYLSSKHSVMKFDIRQMKIVRKWSHFLNSYPIINKSCGFKDSELVYISNLKEKVCLQVSKLENYTPFTIPGIQDTFLECNLRKELILRNDLKKRFDLSTAGLEPVKNNNNNDVTLYTCNSIGDVFCTEFSYDEPDRNKILSEFTSWIDSLPPEPKKLKVTSMKCMEDTKAMMTRPVKAGTKNRYTKVNPGLEPLLKELPNFSVYDFSVIWSDNMEIDDEELGSVTPKHKVAEWLQGAVHENVEKEDDEVDHSIDDITKTEYEITYKEE